MTCINIYKYVYICIHTYLYIYIYRVSEEDEEEGLDSSIHNEKLAGNNKIKIATLKAKSISIEVIVA
jgi:ammonia channel protein AmtB